MRICHGTRGVHVAGAQLVNLDHVTTLRQLDDARRNFKAQLGRDRRSC